LADRCRAFIQKAVDELGGIDILVNNAAHQATFKDIGDISDEEWETTFKTNIHAMFYLVKAAVPHMKPGSAIVNTASVNSDMPNRSFSLTRPRKAQSKTSRADWPRCGRRRASG
jgi:NAD(P)-dependent dehydrogenase (short-subunit alcohol dehydrogenase family)